MHKKQNIRSEILPLWGGRGSVRAGKGNGDRSRGGRGLLLREKRAADACGKKGMGWFPFCGSAARGGRGGREPPHRERGTTLFPARTEPRPPRAPRMGFRVCTDLFPGCKRGGNKNVRDIPRPAKDFSPRKRDEKWPFGPGKRRGERIAETCLIARNCRKRPVRDDGKIVQNCFVVVFARKVR